MPWTETEEQIDRLVSYVKFLPVGIRAASPGYGNSDYDLHVDGRQFIDEANRETVILAHLETRRGVENANAILSNPNVDIAFVGMYGLSDHGYSSWVQLPDGKIYLDDYSNRGDTPPASHFYAALFSPKDFPSWASSMWGKLCAATLC